MTTSFPSPSDQRELEFPEIELPGPDEPVSIRSAGIPFILVMPYKCPAGWSLATAMEMT